MDFIKQFYKRFTNHRVFPVTVFDAVRDYDGNTLTQELAKQYPISNCNQIGGGYYTCTTAGSTAAKVVSANGFQLKPNCSFSVLFTNAFTVANPTLNMNDTGAKALKLFGVTFPYHKVHNNTILNISYDGTDYNVTSLEYYDESHEQGAIDLALPSGLLWADKNVGAARPQDVGLWFSWGNVDGHAEGSGYSFDSTTYYNGTAGASLSGDIAVGNTYDAARHNMGGQWRMPTKEEFQEMYDNCDSIWIEENGMPGRRFTSRLNGNSIFLPAAGHYSGTTLFNRGERGLYWASSFYSAGNGYDLSIGLSAVDAQSNHERWRGFSVRAVM